MLLPEKVFLWMTILKKNFLINLTETLLLFPYKPYTLANKLHFLSKDNSSNSGGASYLREHHFPIVNKSIACTSSPVSLLSSTCLLFKLPLYSKCTHWATQQEMKDFLSVPHLPLTCISLGNKIYYQERYITFNISIEVDKMSMHKTDLIS